MLHLSSIHSKSWGHSHGLVAPVALLCRSSSWESVGIEPCLRRPLTYNKSVFSTYLTTTLGGQTRVNLQLLKRTCFMWVHYVYKQSEIHKSQRKESFGTKPWKALRAILLSAVTESSSWWPARPLNCLWSSQAALLGFSSVCRSVNSSHWPFLSLLNLRPGSVFGQGKHGSHDSQSAWTSCR